MVVCMVAAVGLVACSANVVGQFLAKLPECPAKEALSMAVAAATLFGFTF